MTAPPHLELRGLTRSYPGRQPLADRLRGARPPLLRALDGVSLAVPRGAALGIVGESGCGKSTLARCAVGIEAPTAGEVLLDGRPLAARRTLADRRRVQIVLQDPYGSLNPRMTVGAALAEVLAVHRLRPRAAIPGRVAELLGMVGLAPGVAGALPRQLSGGQRQRVSIARALAPEPEVLIADEPVSALDVSVQATVLNLLDDLRTRLGLTLVLISHGLGVVEYLCDRVAVMYLGRIVEEGPAAGLFAAPCHPYTRALLAAAPRLDDPLDLAAPPAVTGEPPSPFALPAGCRYRPRCPLASPACAAAEPALAPAGAPGHRVACHHAPALSALTPEGAPT